MTYRYETYKYEVLFDHCCVGSDSGFETEEEAYEEARECIFYTMEDWDDPDVTEEDFEIRVEEDFEIWAGED